MKKGVICRQATIPMVVRPKALSHQLRHGRGSFLAQRRGIVITSLSAIGCMGLIVLYQMGLIKHLPEPDWTGLNADKVDGSEEAYSYFATPDAAIGLGTVTQPAIGRSALHARPARR